MCELSGNKGEWSEIYVLLKVLGEGRIYSADSNIKRKPDQYIDISRVIRCEGNKILTFTRVPEKNVVQVNIDGEELSEVSIAEITDQYCRLFAAILTGKNAFVIPETERFIRGIGCTTLKATSKDKTDITVEIQEPKIGMNGIQGFGIMSKLGNPPTLVNPSKATNFIFALEGEMNDNIAKKANEYRNSTSKTKLIDEFTYLKIQNITLRFVDTENKTMYNNLTFLDPAMPHLIGEMLKLYYLEGISKISDQIDKLRIKNPLQFQSPCDTPCYEYRVKKLLSSYALGMQSAKSWTGIEDANGGYIIVREDGDILCYNFSNKINFEDYLIKNTRFDTPSVNRYEYAEIYKDNGEYRLKLNMQIRFI